LGNLSFAADTLPVKTEVKAQPTEKKIEMDKGSKKSTQEFISEVKHVIRQKPIMVIPLSYLAE
jgi:hypothetical protein